jgi:hypothetical protein
MRSFISGLWSLLTSALSSRRTSSNGSESPVLSSESSPESSNKIPFDPDSQPLAWGKKLNREERLKVRDISSAIGFEADNLMACIAFETGTTFSPSIRNAAGSGGTGLIQIMPPTALGLGTTVEALAKMTRLEQLDYVRMYFKPYTGRLHTLSDVYMAILWPRAIGKPEDYVLWKKGTKAYDQNRGLDIDADHDVEKQEAAAKVMSMLELGRRPQNLWTGT